MSLRMPCSCHWRAAWPRSEPSSVVFIMRCSTLASSSTFRARSSSEGRDFKVSTFGRLLCALPVSSTATWTLPSGSRRMLRDSMGRTAFAVAAVAIAAPAAALATAVDCVAAATPPRSAARLPTPRRATPTPESSPTTATSIRAAVRALTYSASYPNMGPALMPMAPCNAPATMFRCARKASWSGLRACRSRARSSSRLVGVCNELDAGGAAGGGTSRQTRGRGREATAGFARVTLFMSAWFCSARATPVHAESPRECGWPRGFAMHSATCL